MDSGSDSSVIDDKLMNTRGELREKETRIGEGNKGIIGRKSMRVTFYVGWPFRIERGTYRHDSTKIFNKSRRKLGAVSSM